MRNGNLTDEKPGPDTDRRRYSANAGPCAQAALHLRPDMPDAHGIDPMADSGVDDPGAAMRNLALAILALAACSHGLPRSDAAHDAAGCLAACPGASVVETSPDGSVCRCWSHTAGLKYTFAFPSSDEKLGYAKGRWEHNLAIVHGCKMRGLGWEPTPDGNDIACMKPDEIDPATKALRWTARLDCPRRGVVSW